MSRVSLREQLARSEAALADCRTIRLAIDVQLRALGIEIDRHGHYVRTPPRDTIRARTYDLLEMARRHIGHDEPCKEFAGDPLHGSCCGHSYARHLVHWLATELHHVSEPQETRPVEHWLQADIEAGPRCPTCNFVMCQQFDERPLTPLAVMATPNGTYRCYQCTPVRAA